MISLSLMLDGKKFCLVFRQAIYVKKSVENFNELIQL